MRYLFREDDEWSSIYFFVLCPPQHQASQYNLHTLSLLIAIGTEGLVELLLNLEYRHFKESEKTEHVF